MKAPRFVVNLICSMILAVTSVSDGYSQQVVDWNDPTGGIWQDTANWSTGFIPTDQDVARFDLPATYTVVWNSLTGDREVDELQILEGNISLLNLTGVQFELAVGINFFNDSVSVRQGGVLQVNGIKLSSVGVVDAGFGGRLLINGNHPAGTTVEADFLQTFGDGTLQINDGAQAIVLRDTMINSEQSPTGVDNDITGVGTNLQTDRLFVDDSGQASLFLSNGGMINAGTLTSIGDLFEGEMTVRHDGSVLNSGRLDVGFQGNGFLRIATGGKVFASGIASMGTMSNSFGRVEVSGSGSELVVNEVDDFSTIAVGELGTGLLVVSFGGRAEAENVIVVGDARIRDQGSRLVAENLQIENQQFGKLSIDNDAAVEVAGTATVDFLAEISMGGSATPQLTAGLTINNGLMDMNAEIGPDVFGSFENNNLIQTAENVDTWFHGNFQHNGVAVETGVGGRTRLLGTVSGAGPYTGPGEVEFVADVRPGSGDGVGVAGLIDIEGMLDFGANANLNIELGGTVIDQNDRIFVDGDASIDGDISVSLINGFLPSAGDVFPIVVIGGTRTGLFNFLGEGDTVATFGNVDLKITYSFLGGNDIALVAVESAFLLGDVNGDGLVNLLDVEPFVQLIASGGFNQAADINMDGAVNLLDVGPFVDLLSGN